MEPSLRPGAEALTYLVRRGARNRALVTRSDGGSELTLLEWARLRSVDWTAVARVILTDALTEPPVRKPAREVTLDEEPRGPGGSGRKKYYN